MVVVILSALFVLLLPWLTSGVPVVVAAKTYFYTPSSSHGNSNIQKLLSRTSCRSSTANSAFVGHGRNNKHPNYLVTNKGWNALSHGSSSSSSKTTSTFRRAMSTMTQTPIQLAYDVKEEGGEESSGSGSSSFSSPALLNMLKSQSNQKRPYDPSDSTADLPKKKKVGGFASNLPPSEYYNSLVDKKTYGSEDITKSVTTNKMSGPPTTKSYSPFSNPNKQQVGTTSSSTTSSSSSSSSTTSSSPPINKITTSSNGDTTSSSFSASLSPPSFMSPPTSSSSSAPSTFMSSRPASSTTRITTTGTTTTKDLKNSNNAAATSITSTATPISANGVPSSSSTSTILTTPRSSSSSTSSSSSSPNQKQTPPSLSTSSYSSLINNPTSTTKTNKSAPSSYSSLLTGGGSSTDTVPKSTASSSSSSTKSRTMEQTKNAVNQGTPATGGSSSTGSPLPSSLSSSSTLSLSSLPSSTTTSRTTTPTAKTTPPITTISSSINSEDVSSSGDTTSSTSTLPSTDTTTTTVNSADETSTPTNVKHTRLVPRTKSTSGVVYQDVFKGISELYPPSDESLRNAKSRTDGYWPFVSTGEDPPAGLTYGEFSVEFYAQVLDHVAELLQSQRPKSSQPSMSYNDDAFDNDQNTQSFVTQEEVSNVNYPIYYTTSIQKRSSPRAGITSFHSAGHDHNNESYHQTFYNNCYQTEEGEVTLDDYAHHLRNGSSDPEEYSFYEESRMLPDVNMVGGIPSTVTSNLNYQSYPYYDLQPATTGQTQVPVSFSRPQQDEKEVIPSSLWHEEKISTTAAPSVQSASPSSAEHFYDDRIVCDIGSGTGRLVAAAAALHPNLYKSKGIEILSSIHDEAINIIRDKCWDEFSGQMSLSDNLPMSNVDLLCGDVTLPDNTDLEDVDVAFVFSTCMPPDLMTKIGKAVCRQMQPGTILITIDQQIPLSEGLEVLDIVDGTNTLVGGTSTAYIYQRVI